MKYKFIYLDVTKPESVIDQRIQALLQFDIQIYSKIKKRENKRKTEKTGVRYNAGDIFYFIFSVLHKKTPSIKSKESDKLEFI